MIKKGFTLAEVLITLGIIGVVAAMTMPTLIQSANDAKVGPELATAVSTLSNAIDNYMQDNNATSVYQALTKAGNNSSSLTAEALINDLIGAGAGGKAYIKATSTSSPGASLKLTMADGGLNGQGAAMLLGNKSILAAETTDCAIAEGTDCGIIFYTSGWGKASKELITGKDVFKLIVRNNGEVLPYGVAGSGSGTTTTPDDDCKSGGDGTTCAGKIANAGWVKEDYDK